jgi:antibiotic biosynthesis monooxygenase (ABM) superfamily enzyme
MVTIDSNKKICTFINVFTVEPEKHLELLELLKETTENIMSKLPGYISASIHLSFDKKTVTNYAQWESLEDFQNMLRNQDALIHRKKVAAIATDFKPATYGEIWTHSK